VEESRVGSETTSQTTTETRRRIITKNTLNSTNNLMTTDTPDMDQAQKQAEKLLENLTGGQQQHSGFLKFRKVLSKVDPMLVTASFSSLFSAIIAVVATLQSQFVRALTLGSSMGDMILKPFKEVLLKKAKENIPADLNKWSEPLLTYATRAIGIAIALSLRHTILTFNLCSKSADLIVEGLKEKGVTVPLSNFIIFIVAVLGFIKQLLYGSSLPLLLWFIAIPFLVLEFVVGVLAVARLF